VRTDKKDPRHDGFDPNMTTPGALGRTADGISLSGNERNNVFLNRSGRQFMNVSGVSGFDDPADGRAVAALDFDRDGWQDLAVVNANSPFLQIFRNEIGGLEDALSKNRNMIALRFVGGNREARPVEGLTARDGFGATAEVILKRATLIREHRAGEGFAAQNSSTLLIGIGSAKVADRVRVRWPSGKSQELERVTAGSLVTAYEDASESPGESGFSVEPYHKPEPAEAPLVKRPGRRLEAARVSQDGGGPRLQLLTTMATWCPKCKAELPQVARLRREFGADDLAIMGIPIDKDDSTKKLDQYEREYAPAYELRKDLNKEQIDEVQQVIRDQLRRDVLPASILTDQHGRILHTFWNVPSVSEVRQALAENET
jgi:thiol-disulfide isomerase/thioredoxin